MYGFRVCVHALAAPTMDRQIVAIEGRNVSTLVVRPDSLGEPFAVSFEQAAERLAELPRMFCEPDGSFVWVSPADEPKWQVEGGLFDRAGKLLYVELQGSCSPEAFDQLLTAFGWPETALAFQLVRAAVFVDESGFRQFALATSAHG